MLLFGGKVATTYFFSTSGGETESIADWGGRPDAVPRLGRRPVRRHLAVPRLGPGAGDGQDDRQDAEGAGGDHGRDDDARTAPDGSARSTSSRRRSRRCRATPPFRPARCRPRSGCARRGSPSACSRSSPRSRAHRSPYGSSIALTGLVRGVAGVTLEQRVSGGSWQPVGPVPAEDGTLQLTEQPTITTDYRLATTTAAAAYVRVRVTPAVTLGADAHGRYRRRAPSSPSCRARPCRCSSRAPI